MEAVIIRRRPGQAPVRIDQQGRRFLTLGQNATARPSTAAETAKAKQMIKVWRAER